MSLSLVEGAGLRILEGQPDQPFITRLDEARLLVEACFEQGARATLLYAPNLPAPFFDLSSGQAGHILQTLQNYRIRLALVCPPGSVSLSSRFSELLAETQPDGDFGIFVSREAALTWLAGVP